MENRKLALCLLAGALLAILPAAAQTAPDPALLPSLLTLADVLGTGHHAAAVAAVSARTRVTVIGDGAVGLFGEFAGLDDDLGWPDLGRNFF